MVFPFGYIADYTNLRINEAQRAFEDFWDSGPIPDRNDTELWQHYTEWLIFDFKLTNGSSFLIEYTLLNPDNLDRKIIGRFKQIAQTQVYSEFQVLDIKSGEWLKLEDIYTGKIYKVYDKSGSETIPQEGSIMARVARVDVKWYLVGANPSFYPITYTKRKKEITI